MVVARVILEGIVLVLEMEVEEEEVRVAVEVGDVADE